MAARASPSRGWVAEKDVLDLNIISRNAVPLPEQDRLVPLAAIVESPSNSSTSDLSVGKVLQLADPTSLEDGVVGGGGRNGGGSEGGGGRQGWEGGECKRDGRGGSHQGSIYMNPS
ncbi:hypothetical protein OsJ_22764 [Oryza sativa Japonica Group]|uniref:Uncharacterized protein n=1 Tax=Oryza sativa subsp. japonica TaxID=39947 RepID=B9FV29_ORYSJ|nr:hypothetical protein OsJ_22764 [Oryza sativa Japonica Group]